MKGIPYRGGGGREIGAKKKEKENERGHSLVNIEWVKRKKKKTEKMNLARKNA